MPEGSPGGVAALKYIAVLAAVESGVSVLWFDYSVVWMKTPDELWENSLTAEWVALEDFFARTLSPAVFLVRPAAAVVATLRTLVAWFGENPFAQETPGYNAVLHRAPTALSFLDSAPALPSLGLFDGEAEIVSLDDAAYFPTPGVEVRAVVTDIRQRWIADALWMGLNGGVKDVPGQENMVQWALCDYFFEIYKAGRVVDLSTHPAVDCQEPSGHHNDLLDVLLRALQRRVSPKRPWTPINASGSGPWLGLQVSHINYAEGCCKDDQAANQESALAGGVARSLRLNGNDLDADFSAKNREILTWPRGMNAYLKAPSGAAGYFVWKPHVFLKALLDPAVPDGVGVVLYTDSGTIVEADPGPVLAPMLRYESDCIAADAAFAESSFTKGDAFKLLGATATSISNSRQIWAYWMACRKTSRAIQFARDFLSACESLHAISETPNKIRHPDTKKLTHNEPWFMNHNDEQSMFSLVFKQYGFRTVPHRQTTRVIYPARHYRKMTKMLSQFEGEKLDKDSMEAVQYA
mmetsp:Transcript_3051/g.6041  ORF Transcript_3051/g.6041 Transcript_3051/m.6041 type:complete len:522 (-) Transcript_3051:48-1613(-)